MNCSKCSGRVWKAGDWSEEELYYCPGCSIHEDGKGQVVDPGSNGFWGGKEEASEMSSKKEVHAEVYYDTSEGNVHSDICPPGCDFEKMDPDYRKFLHDNLDEWLECSNGTGAFYIKGPGKIDGEEEG